MCETVKIPVAMDFRCVVILCNFKLSKNQQNQISEVRVKLAGKGTVYSRTEISSASICKAAQNALINRDCINIKSM